MTIRYMMLKVTLFIGIVAAIFCAIGVGKLVDYRSDVMHERLRWQNNESRNVEEGFWKAVSNKELVVIRAFGWLAGAAVGFFAVQLLYKILDRVIFVMFINKKCPLEHLEVEQPEAEQQAAIGTERRERRQRGGESDMTSPREQEQESFGSEPVSMEQLDAAIHEITNPQGHADVEVSEESPKEVVEEAPKVIIERISDEDETADFNVEPLAEDMPVSKVEETPDVMEQIANSAAEETPQKTSEAAAKSEQKGDEADEEGDSLFSQLGLYDEGK